MRPKLSIVKIGGSVIENSREFETFLGLFAQISELKILVHGGGKKATEIEKKLGISSEYFNGRRITNSQSLDVMIMVYAGLLNKKITAGLQAKNCNAIGLSGADGGVIVAHKRPVGEVDFGLVGDINRVKSQTVSDLLNCGMVPVFCALTHDGSGQLFNTNADTIASELAIGLSGTYETTLYYCFEKQGVLKSIEDENSVIRHIDRNHYERLLQQQVISDGMLPKLENCFHALESKVHQICIGNISMLKPNAELYTLITL